jgi:flagellar FliL protein
LIEILVSLALWLLHIYLREEFKFAKALLAPLKEFVVAEENAAAKEAAAGGHEAKAGKPILLYAIVVLNIIAMLGVGMMLYKNKQKEAESAQTIDKAANGIVKDAEAKKVEGEGKSEGKEGEAKAGDKESEEYVGQMIPLETFLVNLSGNRGNKLLKVNMEFEVEGGKIGEEIDKRKPQIRDIIIILLASKTYNQLSAAEGKEFLRDEIRDTVNSFLSKGKIKRVLFTEFIFN